MPPPCHEVAVHTKNFCLDLEERLRHLHGAVFADVGHAWTGELKLGDVKTGLGAALGADTFLGHGLPFTGVLGVARGLADRGETNVYFRVGLAF